MKPVLKGTVLLCPKRFKTVPFRTGFTLIELVIVIVILGLLLGLSTSFSFIMLDTLGFLTRQANLQESAEVALSRVSRDVRRLRNDQSVVTATASQFTFFDVSSAQITYQLSGGALIRIIDPAGAPPSVTDELADQVTALAITYYNDAGANITGSIVLAPRTNIRRIEFRITLQDGSHTVNAQTRVRPRNLRHESYMFF